MPTHSSSSFFFFFNDTATTEIYTLSLHDALPIYRYSDHQRRQDCQDLPPRKLAQCLGAAARQVTASRRGSARRSEEHTSELQSLAYLVCRLLLEKKKNTSDDLDTYKDVVSSRCYH